MKVNVLSVPNMLNYYGFFRDDEFHCWRKMIMTDVCKQSNFQDAYCCEVTIYDDAKYHEPQFTYHTYRLENFEPFVYDKMFETTLSQKQIEIQYKLKRLLNELEYNGVIEIEEM